MPPGATLVDRFAARTDENLVLAYVEAHVGTVPDKAAMLVRLIVHPCYRRRGVAKTFVRRVLDGLSESGIARVSLFAKHRNIAALELYRSLGFRGCLGANPESSYLLVADTWKKND